MNLSDICIKMNLVTVEDLKCYTIPELIYRLADKLNECGKPARLECGHLPFIMQINSYVPGFANLICDDVQIDIYSKKELLDIAQQVIEKHNQELKQNKMIQLKMEGF